jgi:hypothetical protein
MELKKKSNRLESGWDAGTHNHTCMSSTARDKGPLIPLCLDETSADATSVGMNFITSMRVEAATLF